MKITASVTKSSHQDCGPCCFHLPISYLCIYSPLLLENKKLLWLLFSSVNHTTEHYSIIYVMRLPSCDDWCQYQQMPHTACSKVMFKSIKFWSLLFYSELNKVSSNYVWILLEWVNLHCNWINLISVFSIPK